MNMYIVNNGMWRMWDYLTAALATKNSGTDWTIHSKKRKGSDV